MKENDNPGGGSPEEPENQDPANIPPPPGNPEDYIYVVSWGRWVRRGISEPELFDQDPAGWFKKYKPEWDDERINLEIERIEVTNLLYDLEERRQAFGEAGPNKEEQAEIEGLRQSWEERRLAFSLKFLTYLANRNSE